MSDGDAIIVLQARMGSTRLPGKSMHLVEDRSLLAHCVSRLLAANIARVVVAPTTDREDDVLEDEAVRSGAVVVRGSAEDVLARYVQAATIGSSRFVIRATGDNPAVDIDAPRRVLRGLRFGGADYVAERNLPYGSAVEGIRVEALLQAADEVTHGSDREHVTPYIRRSISNFRIVELDAPAGLSRPDLRFTVDTEEDLAYMRRVLGHTRRAAGPAPLADIIRAADQLQRAAEVA